MKRIVLAGLLGGLAVFVWGSVSWVLLPWHLATMHPIPDGEAVTEALVTRVTAPGIYLYPGVAEPGQEDVVEARYRRGPNINFLAYAPVGTAPMSPAPFLRGFLLCVVTAWLAAALLARAAPTLPGYAHRVLYVALLGGFAALATRLVDWNWMSFPLDYTLVMAADLVLAWLAGGLVIAALITPATMGEASG